MFFFKSGKPFISYRQHHHDYANVFYPAKKAKYIYIFYEQRNFYPPVPSKIKLYLFILHAPKNEKQGNHLEAAIFIIKIVELNQVVHGLVR